MNIKQLLFGSLFIGGVLAVTRLLFAKPAVEKPIEKATSYNLLDEYIEEQRRRLHLPGISLAIVEGDKIVHYRGFGQARPGGEAPTPQTPFFIGSVTKSMTALAIMQLVEAGKVELDAPVQRYLPWFRVADPVASAQMTVRHLLNHTSGLSALQGQIILTELDDSADATKRQLQALSTYKLSSPLGSKVQYNNTNYNILGMIIEAASCEKYADYVQNHIFNPLGMEHSYTSRDIARQHGLAMGHRYWFGYPFPEPNLPIPMGSLPSGQVISCAEDMAHYLIAHLNGGRYGDKEILSRAGIEEMHRPAVEWYEMGSYIGHYAMGWISNGTGKSRIVSHSGIVPDFGAFAGLLPEQKKGIVLIYNANHGMIKLTLDEFGMGAAKLLAGETPSKSFLDYTPWIMRGLVLIPILQVADIVLTFRRLAIWRSDPASRPSRGRMWGQHILLPLIPNLIISLSLIPMLGKIGGWIRLFTPDVSWIARICGGFAGIWAFLRTWLVLRNLHKP